MPDYRLYFLDRFGHITHRLDLDCRDDAHAIEVVQEHRGAQASELWERARLVKRFEATQDA